MTTSQQIHFNATCLMELPTDSSILYFTYNWKHARKSSDHLYKLDIRLVIAFCFFHLNPCCRKIEPLEHKLDNNGRRRWLFWAKFRPMYGKFLKMDKKENELITSPFHFNSAISQLSCSVRITQWWLVAAHEYYVWMLAMFEYWGFFPHLPHSPSPLPQKMFCWSLAALPNNIICFSPSPPKFFIPQKFL